ncbi:hypothetical protein Z951_39560 [Streptomyces sp. PRh5]|uniref:hypothetical protein n=1 Tax=Streptomyces sp. PRh5 TaxID=1158056 RepID=UPI000447F86E|nr:hypothetical protein [Streptomyces sp. PRh5]EXU62749.1 hypothetical protein Z951_39560 [Streptomyces sp. PRh5]
MLGDIARYTALRPVRPAVERGDPEAFAHFDEAGWSKVVMNFRLTPEGEGTLLSTETRVLNTEPATRRAFTLYGGLVRAGSGMIRVDLLRAIGKQVATTEGWADLAAEGHTEAAVRGEGPLQCTGVRRVPGSVGVLGAVREFPNPRAWPRSHRRRRKERKWTAPERRRDGRRAAAVTGVV